MLTAEGLHGVIPAIPTPFTADGRAVDENALRRITRHVVDAGVHAIMTTGGTGEFVHLSRDERRRVTKIVADEAAGATPVIAGTAACSTWEALVLTEDAASAGAAAAILTPPFYFRIPDDMLHAHFETSPPPRRPDRRLQQPLYTGTTFARADRGADGAGERHRPQAVERRPRPAGQFAGPAGPMLAAPGSTASSRRAAVGA
jgi:4-hydroxy-tetrahydrodipicolinate synthase